MLVAFLLEFVRFNGRQFPLARDRSIHWSMCLNHEPVEGRMTWKKNRAMSLTG
jgi:hypothetical protein